MEYFSEYLLFFAKVFTFVIALLLSLLISVAILNKGSRGRFKGKLQVIKLNDKLREMTRLIEASILDKKTFKNKLKAEKKLLKNTITEQRKKLFLIDFKGDIKASAVEKLRNEVTAILQVACPDDEVVLRLESPGGIVHGYGLAAAQLVRIRDKKIPLTVCVDKVAASGGYLMAVTAERILAAPFAIVGSIGVITQLPNFYKFLKKHNIDVEEHTAGAYKRTLSLFGEITDKDREKFRENLDEVHTLFKNFVNHFRPNINIERVTTGEYWLAKTAIELNLVDKLITSDDYLQEQSKKADIFEIKYETKKSLSEKLAVGAASLTHKVELLISRYI